MLQTLQIPLLSSYAGLFVRLNGMLPAVLCTRRGLVLAECFKRQGTPASCRVGACSFSTRGREV